MTFWILCGDVAIESVHGDSFQLQISPTDNILWPVLFRLRTTCKEQAVVQQLKLFLFLCFPQQLKFFLFVFSRQAFPFCWMLLHMNHLFRCSLKFEPALLCCYWWMGCICKERAHDKWDWAKILSVWWLCRNIQYGHSIMWSGQKCILDVVGCTNSKMGF